MSDDGTSGEDELRAALASRSQLVRRQRLFLIVAIAAAVVAIAGLLASLLIRSPAQAAADQAAPKASIVTATVVRKTLISHLVIRGTVVSSQTISVYPAVTSANSTAILTAVPKVVGQSVGNGDVIAQISGRPIIALSGSTPAYRDLVPGASGKDVLELQQALTTLGYLPAGNDNGNFGTATKNAVSHLYQDRGFDPITTFDVDPGETASLQGDTQDVASAKYQLAADELSADETTDPSDLAQANLKVQFDQSQLATAQATLSTFTAASGVEVPLSELVFVPSFPATVGSVNFGIGAQLSGSGGPLMTLNVGTLAVSAIVPAGEQRGVGQGAAVAIGDIAEQRSAFGTVASLGQFSNGSIQTEGSASTNQSTQNGNASTSAQAGYPLTVTPNKPLDPSWLNEDVSVTITTGRTPHKVLTVPVISVHSRANGSSYVELIASNKLIHEVTVKPGFTANGEQQVTAVGNVALKAGEKVVTTG